MELNPLFPRNAELLYLGRPTFEHGSGGPTTPSPWQGEGRGEGEA